MMFDIHAIKAAAYSIAVDGEGFRFHDTNRAALDLAGISVAFQPGLAPHDVFPPQLAALIVEQYRACCAGQVLSYATNTVVGTELRRWQTTLFPIAGADGRPAFIYAICCRLDAKALVDLPTLALDTLDGGFWTLDLATREFRTSRRLAEKIAGPGHLSMNLAEYLGHIHADDLRLELPDADQEVTVEFRVFTHDGRMRWLQTRRRPIRDPLGRPTHVVGIVLDVTESKLAMKRLEEEAATDMLTRIGNRRAFERAAERCFDGEDGHRFGMVVVDLDDFKPVNDRYGHRVGDDILRAAGQRLAEHVAPGGLLARIGGDEFSILLPDTTLDQVEALLQQIETAFLEPLVVDGRSIVVGASCGSAIRSSCDHSVGDIFARADRALYATKESRRRVRA